MNDQFKILVLKKLKKAGWISEFTMISHDGPPATSTYAIKWTAEGRQKKRKMLSLLVELGYGTGYVMGELEALHDLCTIPMPEED